MPTHLTSLHPALLRLLLTFLVLLPAAPSLRAQQQKQHGVARMITRSAKDPVVPVSGAQITLGNSTQKSDARGQFTLNVTKNKAGSYRLSAVKGPKGSDLILASPRLSDAFSLSTNNLVLAFTTDEDKKQYYKELYLKFYKKYNDERSKLKALRLELNMKQLELEKTSAEYQRVSARLDSVQALLDTEFGEQQEENVAKNLGYLAEQLIVTDYQSLEANDAKIYELRCAGDWEALSEYLLELMDGDPDAYAQEGVDIKNAALQEYARRLDRLKKLIESYTSQGLYAKAAHYYKTLIKADSTNWENYNGAGALAAFSMGDYELAQNYFAVALNYANSDTARAAIYTNIGATYFAATDYVHAEQYTQKALELLLALHGEWHSDVAATYDKLGDIYSAQRNNTRANACHQKASDITFHISPHHLQRFVVRMITRSASEPLRPVSGVRIVVNNIVSTTSDAEGRITLSVPVDEYRSFRIQDVRVPRGSNLILASPSKNRKLFLSKDDCVIALVDITERDSIRNSSHKKLLAKYRNRINQLRQQRTQTEERLDRTNREDTAQYNKLLMQRDSLHALLLNYFDSNIDSLQRKELERTADELSLTDYQSLDSLEQRIYTLKKEGEWKQISDIIVEYMGNGPEDYIQEAVAQKNLADLRFREVEANYKKYLWQLHLKIIEYKERQLNDSASYCYALLTHADSTNAAWLAEAGAFELNTMKRYDRAVDYFNAALRNADADSLRADVYCHLGETYAALANYDQAFSAFTEALKLQLSTLGADHPDVAITYRGMGLLYSAQGDHGRAEEYLQKALEIATAALGADHPTTKSIKEALNAVRAKKRLDKNPQRGQQHTPSARRTVRSGGSFVTSASRVYL